MSYYAATPEIPMPLSSMQEYFADDFVESDGEDELEIVCNALEALKGMLATEYMAEGSERLSQLRQLCSFEYAEDEVSAQTMHAESMLVDLQALMDPVYAGTAANLISTIILLLRD